MFYVFENDFELLNSNVSLNNLCRCMRR